MNGSETSTPSASPSGPTSRRAAGWCRRSRSRCRARGRPARGGWAAIAASPWAPRPPATRSRYLTKRSKSGPLQASVASAFSGRRRHRRSYARPRLAKRVRNRCAQRRLAVLVGAPAPDLVVAQLEDQAISSTPAREPSSSQRQTRRISATALPPPASEPFLVELLELDRLLHAPRLPRRPQPRRLAPLTQAPHACSSTSGSSTATNASRSRSLKARMNSRTGSVMALRAWDQAGRGTQGGARGAHLGA